MKYRVEWRRYRREFRQPLRVSGQKWAVREGLILRLEDGGEHVGFGEVAPVPWFPVERLTEAEAFLSALGGEWDGSGLRAVTEALPCTAFALGCALEPWRASSYQFGLPYAALLPAGAQAVEAARQSIERGFTTLKWKIGVDGPEREWGYARALLEEAIRGRALLRLDANGGLTPGQLRGWARVLQGAPVGFIEQPLPVGQEEEASVICQEAGLPLAFDESACTLSSLKALALEYPGATYIIKPSQAGDPQSLRAFLKEQPRLRRVYSSAFESAVGLDAVWNLTAADRLAAYASGFGTGTYFPDDKLGVQVDSPFLPRPVLRSAQLEMLWKLL